MAFSKAFWNNETHVFMEFLRTFGTFPEGQADRKKVPLLIKAVENVDWGHRYKIFIEHSRMPLNVTKPMSCFVVLIDSVSRYKCDCTGRACPGVMGHCRFLPGGLAIPDGYHAYQKVCLVSSNNLHECVCYISMFTEIDQSDARAVVSM
jgi:hypothetical protein